MIGSTHGGIVNTFSLSEAEGQLSRLVELAVAGEDVTITKDGCPVAKLVSTVACQQLPSLAEFRSQLPTQAEPAGEFIRRLRDSDRY